VVDFDFTFVIIFGFKEVVEEFVEFDVNADFCFVFNLEFTVLFVVVEAVFVKLGIIFDGFVAFIFSVLELLSTFTFDLF